MKVYIGTKVVKAEPMDILKFTEQTGRDMKVAIRSDGTAPEGYKVQYEDGYVSWSPKEVFERCYREITQSEKELI